MRKAFFFLLFINILFLNSCLKDKGKPIPPPYDFKAVEGFEGSLTLPSGWAIYNPDGDAAWQVDTTVALTGKHCVGFNNCSGDGTQDMTGSIDKLITPEYDLTKATSASISFDVAYAYLNYHNTKPYPDTLIVYSSTDGGVTWSQIYMKSGDVLANIPAIDTVSSTQPCWAPSLTTDWRNDEISVNNVAGKAHVKFAFENHSGWGEWIRLDNITVTASNGNNNCSGITYVKDIQPIIMNNCATAGCHVSGGTGPTDFSTFAGVKVDADNGTLKKRMIDGNPSFMPASGKLPDSDLSKVKCWLNNGALNN